MQYNFFVIYLAIINLISFFTMGIDKYKAKKKSRRISEKSLFVLAIIFGSIGIYTGMYVFRHKTKKVKFKILIPLIIILQVIVYYKLAL